MCILTNPHTHKSGMVAGDPSTSGDKDRWVSKFNKETLLSETKVEGASERAQRVKSPAATPDHLSLTPGTHVMLEEN